MLKCPKCGSEDLRVLAEVPCNVKNKTVNNCDVQETTISTDSEPYWDRDNDMLCASCDYSATVRDFNNDSALPRASSNEPGGRHDTLH